jgi:hypothetical protein
MIDIEHFHGSGFFVYAVNKAIRSAASTVAAGERSE